MISRIGGGTTSRGNGMNSGAAAGSEFDSSMQSIDEEVKSASAGISSTEFYLRYSVDFINRVKNRLNDGQRNREFLDCISAFSRGEIDVNAVREKAAALFGGINSDLYRELEGFLPRRSSDAGAAELDSFMQSIGEKGMGDASLTFGPMEGTGGSALNLEKHMDPEAHPFSIITEADAVNVSPKNRADTPPGKGEQRKTYCGRVITVKMGEYTKRIGINGTGDAIKETIKSAFGLRTKRAFWLEDEDNVVRALDRDMPLGNYTLHVDEEHLPVHTEEKTFYTDDDFCQFLSRRFWTCLRENGGYRHIDSMDELCHGAVYRGVSSSENILF
ncbi:trihelix transcription factor GT-1-like isoform X2 [Salvia hispanica]|uniref:trihelix transcription factor GT-1-like isoform X2 n=1 Tax=Salvia hispanica TaxID=49212 RepID=UPI002009AE62|nr:trihelix transcription factor GT-1-like isoform X2 [Salvia hispanica]